MSFARAVDFVLAHEGEWGAVPDDPGGRTRWGISARAHPDVDLDGITKRDAIGLYRRHYWEPIAGDALPWPVALAMFDGAVQHGIGAMVRILQNLVGVRVDGQLGPVTLAAVRRHEPGALFDAVLVERALVYDRLNRGLRGWWRRLIACHREGMMG